MATYLGNLAGVLARQNKAPEAETVYGEALALRRQLLGNEHPSVANLHHNLADLLRRSRRFEQAAKHFRAALRVRRGALGEDHVDVANSLYGLGITLSFFEAPQVVEPVLRQGLDLWLLRPDEGARKIAALRSLLGGTLTELGRFAEAEPILEASYEAKADRRTLNRLLDLYEAWGRPHEAARYRERPESH